MDRTTALNLPDGRSLDLYLVGPENAPSLVFHGGTPSSGIPSPHILAAAEELGLRAVSWSRPGYGSSTLQPGRDVAAVAADTAAVQTDNVATKAIGYAESVGPRLRHRWSRLRDRT